MSTVAHFFMIIVAQKFVITWLTFSLTFTQKVITGTNDVEEAKQKQKETQQSRSKSKKQEQRKYLNMNGGKW